MSRSREKEGREDESSSSLYPLSVGLDRREEKGREEVEDEEDNVLVGFSTI